MLAASSHGAFFLPSLSSRWTRTPLISSLRVPYQAITTQAITISARATHRWKALAEAVIFEYRHAYTRAIDMLSAMADVYSYGHPRPHICAHMRARPDNHGLYGHGLCKGANIFDDHSGIRHLHYARLAHYHMPQNTDFDPLGRVGVRQCEKSRQSNLFRLHWVRRRGAMQSGKSLFGPVRMSECERNKNCEATHSNSREMVL